MKVFTVGLDQKPPLEKSPESPPPGYSAPGGATAIPMGPEAPQPIFVKKTKGYKGVLVCMLAVFLIGLFALTLSEIAYNRQRDENFFRLRWAELKHKMGYDYANAAERIYTLRRQQEFQGQPIVPENLQAAPTTTTTIKTPIIDSSVEKEASAQQDTDEQQTVSVNDRLAFFRKLLEGIKKHAEEMGFDGTMQVSVLQVDPEQLQQQLRERLMQQHEREHEGNNDDSSNMDGFGEWAMPQALQQQQQQQQGPFRFDDDYSGDFEQQQQAKQAERFRGFNNWQMPAFENWNPNRVDTPFFPQRPFWWQQQQHQRPQTPFFFQQGPMPQTPFSQQQQQQQQPLQSFIQNEIQQQQQHPQPQFPQQQQQQPQVIFFPNHNINQFQAQQQPQQQQQPEMNMFPHPPHGGNNFIPPEDRIQIEPPSTPEQLNRWRMNNQRPFDFKSNEGPRGWTHQDGSSNDAFIQPQHHLLPPPPPAVMPPPLRFGGSFAPQPNALPPNGVPEEPKKWENTQPLPAISIDSVSEPLPSWAIENSLESETPFAEIQPEEDLISHESSAPSNTVHQGDTIPRPPSIQPEDDNTETSHLNILPIKEIQGEHQHSGEIKSHDEKAPINDEPEPPVAAVAKEPTPVEVDFPAVKFPISDDVAEKQHREPIFFQVDDPHPSQFEK